jgi:hypothetical protein
MVKSRSDIVYSNTNQLKKFLDMELFDSKSIGVFGMSLVRVPGGLICRQNDMDEAYTTHFIPRSEILADLTYFKADRESSGRYFIARKEE